MRSRKDNCIYCGRFASLTKEHVVPRCLGGTVTARLVCDDCRFSDLDQALAERSMISFCRAGFTTHAAQRVKHGGEHFYFEPTEGIHLDMSIENELTPVLLPQLHFRDEGRGRYTALLQVPNEERCAALLAYVESLCSSGGLRDLHVRAGPADVCSTSRIVMHRSACGFFRARSEDDGRRILGFLEEKLPVLLPGLRGLSLATIRSHSPTKVDIRHGVVLNEEHRAVAKIAFNFMAMELGRRTALDPAFQGLRAYVAGTDVRDPPHLTPGQIAVDPRFVSRFQYGHRAPIPTEGHAVTLFCDQLHLCAWVTLYRHHQYLVQMGRSDLPHTLLRTRQFEVSRLLAST